MRVMAIGKGVRIIQFSGLQRRLRALDVGDCWEVDAVKDRKGYGKTGFEGRIVASHRVIYCLANKLTLDDIEGVIIRHKCDNPPCINPDHLEPGTYQDNANDRESRGRGVYLPGERNGQAKLTADQVRSIRIETGTLDHLAEKYKVDRSTIHLIKKRKKWKHIQ